MTDEQCVKPMCGHGHGRLIEIQGYGLRCPSCFPEIFIAEMERLRRLVGHE